MPLKEWLDPVHQDRVQLAQVRDQKAVSSDQVVQDLVELEALAQDLVLRNLEWVAQVHLAVSQVVPQLEEEAAVLAAVQQELLVRVVQEVNLRPENLSAPREKNSNKEAFQVLVEQLSQEVMAQQLSGCVAEPRFRTLPTRLMPMPAS
jgi:hypothetical protein